MDPADRADLEAFVGVGSVLAGKYRIERVLGVGGMGAVVAAHHEQLHERVAIKFLLPRTGQKERLATRFLREARTASKLKSAHVARVFDVDSRPDGTPFMVMEYLEGETLAARFQRQPQRSAKSIVDDVLEACVALAEAHALGIVHRDLKPANLFAAHDSAHDSDHFSVRVLDFGISKLIEPRPGDEPITQDLPIGSPPYMSPEQLTTPASVDHRTDIWSLGVVLYEGLSGDQPFVGDTFAEVTANVLQRQPAPLSAQPALDQVVRRCLAKDREQRFPNIDALAQALAPHAQERGQRALADLETWRRRRSRAAEAALTPPNASATAHANAQATRTADPSADRDDADAAPFRDDVGTATGTVDPTRIPPLAPRSNRRALVALAAAAGVAALLVVLLRPTQPSEPVAGSALHPSAEPTPVSLAPAPSSAAIAPVPLPSASSSAGASLRPVDKRSAPKPKAGRGGGENQKFDPVFDERR